MASSLINSQPKKSRNSSRRCNARQSFIVGGSYARPALLFPELPTQFDKHKFLPMSETVTPQSSRMLPRTLSPNRKRNKCPASTFSAPGDLIVADQTSPRCRCYGNVG